MSADGTSKVKDGASFFGVPTFRMLRGATSGRAKGAGDGERWLLRGPVGRVGGLDMTVGSTEDEVVASCSSPQFENRGGRLLTAWACLLVLYAESVPTIITAWAPARRFTRAWQREESDSCLTTGSNFHDMYMVFLIERLALRFHVQMSGSCILSPLLRRLAEEAAHTACLHSVERASLGQRRHSSGVLPAVPLDNSPQDSA